MPHYINDKGYLCYVKSGYRMSNTHGADYATAELHKSEFEAIVNEIIDEKLNQLVKTLSEAVPSIIDEYGRTVWTQLINNLVGVLQTDIYSQVNVGFEGLRDVFYGEKCQKYISDSIMKQLTKELSKIKGMTIK